jgi:hypothetical protein
MEGERRENKREETDRDHERHEKGGVGGAYPTNFAIAK